MARTDATRYDQALAHVKGINLALGTDINTKVGVNAAAVGAELSLKGKGYWSHGDNRNMALRALLLCHIAYFRPPHGSTNVATFEAVDAMKRDCHGKSLNDLNAKIREFLIDDNASLNGLVNASNRVSVLSGTVDYFKRSRTDTNIGKSPICYDGVVNWLFTAGFVSKKYLAKEALDMHATRSNLYIGQGQPVTRQNWNQIPLGYIWNIQRKGDPSTCHWGLSLGNGRAVACNNTAGSPFYGLVNLQPPAPAGMAYGKFDLEELCLVLNSDLKYGHRGGKTAPASDDVNIAVRQINPLTAGCYR